MRLACLAAGLLWLASAAAETLYRLPWADGRSFMFIPPPAARIATKATLHAVHVAMPEGTPVVAARDGVVEALEARHAAAQGEEPLTYEGNFVRLRHADGSAASYAHLGHGGVVVAVGDAVARGQLIAYSGASGEADEPHLQFTVTKRVKNGSGWEEEISLPVTFYVGEAPMAFAPRVALRARADYSRAAQPPRAPSEVRLHPWALPTLQPGEEPAAWTVLALWLAGGAAALVWFWRFSKAVE